MTARKSEGDKAPVGRPSKYDPKFCDEVVLAAFDGYSLGAFAGVIGVSHQTVKDWKEAHPEFLAACMRAKAVRQAHWEKAAIRVAAKGGGPGTAQIIQFALRQYGEDWSDTQRVEAKVDAKVEHSADDAFASLVSALDIAAKNK